MTSTPSFHGTNFKDEEDVTLTRRSACYAETTPASSSCHMYTCHSTQKNGDRHEIPTPTRSQAPRHGPVLPFNTNAMALASNGRLAQRTEVMTTDGEGGKDKEQIDVWIQDRTREDHRRSGLSSTSKTERKRNHHRGLEGRIGYQSHELLRYPGEGTHLVASRVVRGECLHNDTVTSTRSEAISTQDDPKPSSRFSEDTQSTCSGVSELPKPITYADRSPPLFTNPFGGNRLLAPLPPLTRDDYIPLANIFLQREDDKSPSPPTSKAPLRRKPPPTVPSSMLRAKDISPFDTSEMTPADRKMRRRLLFEEARRAWKKPHSNTSSSARFRARQREIRANKPGTRPPVPLPPKRPLILPYFRRKEDKDDLPEVGKNENEKTRVGGFQGFLRRTIPECVLRGLI
ncbi:hypothetical protein L218DRAFT_994301 [Marasmius fiardii PR-910]|nr:hypothetical protein L218DRAFT_994301 [Marasmius fiardii PR-910]